MNNAHGRRILALLSVQRVIKNLGNIGFSMKHVKN